MVYSVATVWLPGVHWATNEYTHIKFQAFSHMNYSHHNKSTCYAPAKKSIFRNYFCQPELFDKSFPSSSTYKLSLRSKKSVRKTLHGQHMPQQ